ncbi:hypothetical protein GGR55DRAFT_582178 [Xylaria sp. FL0064]|nr:hypothetical protein GGR55DRAFT_582178 [Xylaria sp. FL0064]
MGVPGTKVGYIVQAVDIFPDIETRTGEKVIIAAPEDFGTRDIFTGHRLRHPSIASSVFSSWSTGSSAYPSSSTSTQDIDEALPIPTSHLPCEFVGYSNCDRVFTADETEQWIEHIVADHLHDILPTKCLCWFCDDFTFDSKQTRDRRTNFDARMYHIRDHIVYEKKTVNDMRPDHFFNKHLRDHSLISEDAYNNVRRWSEAP